MLEDVCTLQSSVFTSDLSWNHSWFPPLYQPVGRIMPVLGGLRSQVGKDQRQKMLRKCVEKLFCYSDRACPALPSPWRLQDVWPGWLADRLGPDVSQPGHPNIEPRTRSSILTFILAEPGTANPGISSHLTIYNISINYVIHKPSHLTNTVFKIPRGGLQNHSKCFPNYLWIFRHRY